MTENSNIENIFKESFERFSVNPDKSVWIKINKTLFYNNFLKFNPLKFNIWYGLIILSFSAVLYLLPNKIDVIKTTENNASDIKKTKTNTPFNSNDTEIQSADKEYKNSNIVYREKSDSEIKNNNVNSIDNNIQDNFRNQNQNTNSESNNAGIDQVKLADPKADFSASDYTACEPATITFTNASENCEGYKWDFGNGEFSSLKNPTIVFKTAGTYTVTLKCVSGSFSISIQKTITVLKKPEAHFNVKHNNHIFQDEKIDFIFSGSNSLTNEWIFGDGNSSKTLNANHLYEFPGTYDVSLISYNSECRDTFILNNLVVKDSKYKIIFPTAFSPDLSGASSGYLKSESKPNSIFYPILNFETIIFQFYIYDKFGNQVFESYDPTFGWNGYYLNKPAASAVYIWECKGKFIDGEIFNMKGNVTLIHSEY